MFKNNQGFTIIELVVSASIIVALSILVIANFRGHTQKATLDNEAERLSSSLRQAHINALIGQLAGDARPAGGFGINLATCAGNCHYTMYADSDNTHTYTSGEDFQTINMLDDNVSINSDVDIDFTPPQGDIYINGDIIVDDITITLGFQNSSYTKDIIINRHTGKIDIN